MKKLKQIINEVSYWKLPPKVIHNNLYHVRNELHTMYDVLKHDGDLDMTKLENIIDSLVAIKKKAVFIKVR